MSVHYNALIVLAGVSLLGLTAGVVGCFAVLRRRALMGDAIGHATLPGLCLAYFFWGERSLPVLLLGALLSGLLSVLAFAGIQKFSRLREDAGIAIVLSVFYAAGVVGLSVLRSGRAGLESFLFGQTAGMILEDVLWIGGLAVFSLGVTTAMYKELKLVAFDSGFARVQGWPTGVIDLVLMLLIAVVVVLGLPAVGALLIAALLIIPAAAARFWTHRLGLMLALAGVFGMVSGVVGTAISVQSTKVPTGPAIIFVAVAIFAASVIRGEWKPAPSPPGTLEGSEGK